MVHGAPVPGMELAGGFEFKAQWGACVSTNITPEPETGIGKWTKSSFVQLFKRLTVDVARSRPVARGGSNTVMPWTVYSGMTETDLAAIFEYLRTVKPVKHKVATAAS